MAAELAQLKMIGVRLDRSSLSCSRALSGEQRTKAEQAFEAGSGSISGRRRSINTKHPLVKPILSLMLEARYFVRDRSVDLPGETGVRLMRADQVQTMVASIEGYKARLNILTQELEAGWEDVVEEARDRLKDLFTPADYPSNPGAHFAIDISFPAIKPDERLKKIDPALYEAEQKRILARFEDAVSKAEAVAVEKIRELLTHLLDRMKPDAEGKTKILRSSTWENIKDFVARFKEISIGSNEAIDAVVTQLEHAVSGKSIDKLRKGTPEERLAVQNEMQAVLAELDAVIVAKPKRTFDLED